MNIYVRTTPEGPLPQLHTKLYCGNRNENKCRTIIRYNLEIGCKGSEKSRNEQIFGKKYYAYFCANAFTLC